MANLLRLSTLCVSFLFTFFHYLSRPLTHSLTVPRTRRRTQYTTVLLAIYIMTYTIIEILPERKRYQVSYKAWAMYCAILKDACLNQSVSSPTVRIPAFQAGDPGSTPGWRIQAGVEYSYWTCTTIFDTKSCAMSPPTHWYTWFGVGEVLLKCPNSVTHTDILRFYF